MIIFKTKLAGYDITLDRKTKNKFTVRYGEQYKDSMGRHGAAKELGQCIFHALQCEGKLD
jgi:hypothetical protein